MKMNRKMNDYFTVADLKNDGTLYYDFALCCFENVFVKMNDFFFINGIAYDKKESIRKLKSIRYALGFKEIERIESDADSMIVCFCDADKIVMHY